MYISFYLPIRVKYAGKVCTRKIKDTFCTDSFINLHIIKHSICTCNFSREDIGWIRSAFWGRTRPCSEYFYIIQSFTKIEGQLVLPSRIFRRRRRRHRRRRRRRVSRMKCLARMKRAVVCRTNERVGAKVEVVRRHRRVRREEERWTRGERENANDRPLQTGRKWQVEGLLRLRGRIVCNRHSRTHSLFLSLLYPSKISNARECAEILSIALFLTLSRAMLALFKMSLGTRIEERGRGERKGKTFRLSSTRVRIS